MAIRFGHDSGHNSDPDCIKQDEVLYKLAEHVVKFATIYVCDISQVYDFNQMYGLYDSCTIMFFSGTST